MPGFFMYRIYARWPNQRVSDKTVTPSPAIAAAAYRELMAKREYWGRKIAAVLTLDNRQLEYCRFDRLLFADENLRELQRLGDMEYTHQLPVYLYPDEKSQIERLPTGGCMVLYLDPVADAPLLRGEPLKLSHVSNDAG